MTSLKKLNHGIIKFLEDILSDFKSSPKGKGVKMMEILTKMWYYRGSTKFDQNVKLIHHYELKEAEQWYY